MKYLLDFREIALLAIFFAGFSGISAAKNYSVVGMEPPRTNLTRGNYAHLIKVTIDDRLTSSSRIRVLDNDDFGMGSICAKKGQIIFQKQIEFETPQYHVEHEAFQTTNNPHSAKTMLSRLADYKNASQFQLSEDQKKLVFIAEKTFSLLNNPTLYPSWALYVYDLESNTCKELVDANYTCERPDFSPDGSQVAFYRFLPESISMNYPPEKRGKELCIVSSNGGPIKIISTLDDSIEGIAGSGTRYFPPQWSSDGKKILYIACYFNPEDKQEFKVALPSIWLADSHGTTTPEMLVAWGHCPSWSTDAKQFCYFDASERPTTLKVMDLQTRKSRLLISGIQFRQCLWCPEGDLIAYIEGPGGSKLSFISSDGKRQLRGMANIMDDKPIFWVH